LIGTRQTHCRATLFNYWSNGARWLRREGLTHANA
jgi:hypothetical protein